MEKVIKIIDELKQNGLIKDYAIGGGIATIFYVEPFLTYDLEEAVSNAKQIEYEGVKTKIMTPEYLLSLLLRAGRKKDIEKIEKLLEQTEIDMEKLKGILHKYGLSEKIKLL